MDSRYTRWRALYIPQHFGDPALTAPQTTALTFTGSSSTFSSTMSRADTKQALSSTAAMTAARSVLLAKAIPVSNAVCSGSSTFSMLHTVSATENANAAILGRAGLRTIAGSTADRSAIQVRVVLAAKTSTTALPTAATRRITSKAPTGSLSFVGTVGRGIPRVLNALLGFSGMNGVGLSRSVSAILGFLGSLLSGLLSGVGSVPGRVHTSRSSGSILLSDFNTAAISLLDQSATVRLDSHPTDTESE